MSDYNFNKDEHSIQIAGPAGLTSGDIMYKWDKLPTQIALNDACTCSLCHSIIRRKERMRMYIDTKKRKGTYACHEGCFFTYRDIIIEVA